MNYYYCAECEKKIIGYEPDIKQRLKRSKSGNIFCGYDCLAVNSRKIRLKKKANEQKE